MAFASTVVWEIRPVVTGSAGVDYGASNNGGGFDPTSGTPGTDYSQQNAAERKWIASGGTPANNTHANDLASTSASGWLVLTSAAYTFQASDVGNVINITAGTNFTAGRYQIMSVSGGAATLDRACGATANASGGSGYLGGTIASIAQNYNAVAPGNIIWMRAGADTDAAFHSTNNGSALLPIQWCGYYSVRGDITFAASSWAEIHTTTGFLNTSKMPLLDVGSATYTFGTFNIVMGIRFTGNRNAASVATNGGGGQLFRRCAFTNTGTGASSQAVTPIGGAPMDDCDISMVGASGQYAATCYGPVTNCRITSTNGGGIAAVGCSVIRDNVFYSLASGQNAIFVAGGGALTVMNNTFHSVGTCVGTANSSLSPLHLTLRNNQATNCTAFCTNGYAATNKYSLFGGTNRIRNTTTPYTGWNNVTDTTGYLPGDITTAQTDAAEYVASTATPPDLRLTSAAAGKGAGMPPYLDTGAWQRQEPAGSFPILTSTIVRGIP
jgi:hypothetical protein